MVRTTPEERQEIREIIAGVHNAVFRDQLRPQEIELTQLLSDDVEMDAADTRFGVNFSHWRRWGPTKKLEVLLHEMTHVADPDDNHRPSFWDRFVDIIEIAETYSDQIEDTLDAEIDWEAVKKKIVDEVHEDVIDQRMDTVEGRRRRLREQLGLRKRSKLDHPTGSR